MKVIKVKDGTLVSRFDIRKTLGELLFNYCGSDAYIAFDEYIDSLIEDINWYKDNAEYWRDLYYGG